ANSENSQGEKYLFRGQGCSSWGLVSSFDRKFAEHSPAELDALYSKRMHLFEKNHAIYGNISKDTRGIRLPRADEQSEHTIEALAQHYGLSTRLLDWSYSVYVASFFAFSGTLNSSTGMVSIWALDSDAFGSFSTDHLEHLNDFYEQNVRNLWQMGSFSRNRTTIHNLEDLFRKSSKHAKIEADDMPKLVRFDIPIESEFAAISDLSMMRISSMTIFPGIEGVVKWIEEGC
ncbi:MAG: FRG domain-containing protein, partial [Pseudomonadota bacterium]